MMKTDVLDNFDTIKACVAYKVNGVETKELPYELNSDIEPVFVDLPGWKTNLTEVTSEGQFPEALKSYIKFIEKETGVPVKIVSVGPNREQTIIR
jgi:adenylosuccinate synthase